MVFSADRRELLGRGNRAENMKNIIDVLKQKEAEIQRLQKDVEVLRLALPLLSEEGEQRSEERALTGTSPDARSKGVVAEMGGQRQFP